MKQHVSSLVTFFHSLRTPLFFGFIALAGWGCRKELNEEVKPANVPAENIAPSPYFNTADATDVLITGRDSYGRALRMNNIEIYTRNPESGGKLITRGFTTNGEFRTLIPLATALQEVYIKSNYVGVKSGAYVSVSGGHIRYGFTLQWPKASSGARIEGCSPSLSSTYNANLLSNTISPARPDINTMGDGDVPCYVYNKGSFNTLPNSDLLDDVNEQLPEGATSDQGQLYVDVNKQNADYLVTAQPNNAPTQKVEITFIGEAASFKNTLGYYWYDPSGNTPGRKAPTTIAEIQALAPKIVFPNTSLAGENGSLAPGSTVQLIGPEFSGKFKVGTAIGWFIISNGWNPSNKQVTLQSNGNIFFSNAKFNPENPNNIFNTRVTSTGTIVQRSQNQHVANVGYANKFAGVFGSNGGTVIGFEDALNLSNGRRSNGDADFNDVLFYVTPSSNALEAIDVPGGPLVIEQAKGTLLFEDLWPVRGDYDMNDLVADYECKYEVFRAGYHSVGGIRVINSQQASVDGDIQKILFRTTFRALGGGYHNSFSIVFPFTTDKVSGFQATVANAQGSSTPAFAYVMPGLTGSDQYTIIVSDDSYKSSSLGMSTTILNTSNADGAQNDLSFDPIDITISLVPNVKTLSDGSNKPGMVAPFNPYINANLRANAEIHLPGMPPSKIGLTSTPFLFGGGNPSNVPLSLNVPNSSYDDNSFATEDGTPSGKIIYYLTKPTYNTNGTLLNGASFYALNIDQTLISDPKGFRWPVERVNINDAYPDFPKFINNPSNPAYKDWYLRFVGYNLPDNYATAGRYIYTK